MSPESSEIRKGRGTAVQFDREVELTPIDTRTNQIAQQMEGNESLVCYVFGMGAQPKSTYRSLEGIDGVAVLWNASILPSHGGG